jgi:[acyl-carrier-protein] S-malonyltransferase
VKGLLVGQVVSPVRWEASMRWLAGAGVIRAFELGPGAVLRGLARRIVKGLEVTSVGEPPEVEKVEV